MRNTGTSTFFALLLSAFSAPAFGQSGWNVLNSGTANDLSAVHFVDVENGFVAGVSGTVLKTTTGGASWQNVSPAGWTSWFYGVYAFDISRVVVVGEAGMIMLTTNGGTTWSPVSSGVADDLYSVSFVSGIGICGGASQTILRSTDAGTSWSIVQSGFFGGGFWGACLLSSQIGFVGGENSIFQPLAGTTTDGENWTFGAFYFDNNEGRMYGIDFTDHLTGYAAGAVWDGRGAVSRTSNGGADWSTIFFPDVIHAVDFPVSATGLTGYAVGAAGRIIRTANAGTSWQQQVSGTSSTLRGVHFPEMHLGYVAGEGGVILKTTTGGEPPAGVDDDPFRGQFSLLQNYPNPFNPTTTISFHLSRPGVATLNVFTILGEKIGTLVAGQLDAGDHAVRWNAEGLPGGVYFYRLESEGIMQSKHMVLLR